MCLTRISFKLQNSELMFFFSLPAGVSDWTTVTETQTMIPNINKTAPLPIPTT